MEAYFKPEAEIEIFDYGSAKFFRAIKTTVSSTSDSLIVYEFFFEFNDSNYSTNGGDWETCF